MSMQTSKGSQKYSVDAVCYVLITHANIDDVFPNSVTSL
jgi:hypothetical protein